MQNDLSFYAVRLMVFVLVEDESVSSQFSMYGAFKGTLVRRLAWSYIKNESGGFQDIRITMTVCYPPRHEI